MERGHGVVEGSGQGCRSGAYSLDVWFGISARYSSVEPRLFHYISPASLQQKEKLSVVTADTRS